MSHRSQLHANWFIMTAGFTWLERLNCTNNCLNTLVIKCAACTSSFLSLVYFLCFSHAHIQTRLTRRFIITPCIERDTLLIQLWMIRCSSPTVTHFCQLPMPWRRLFARSIISLRERYLAFFFKFHTFFQHVVNFSLFDISIINFFFFCLFIFFSLSFSSLYIFYWSQSLRLLRKKKKRYETYGHLNSSMVQLFKC